MYKILVKEELAPTIKLFKVEARMVAKKARPGQFVILRIDEKGERIPLTIYDYDKDRGTISIIFQEVGKTTVQLGGLEQGDCLLDVVGPLGNPFDIGKVGKVVCVGGGIGVAPIFPKALALKDEGNEVTSIIGARTKELLILEEEMKKVSQRVYITTDDGSYGEAGFVTAPLKRLLNENPPDLVVAIGPLVMMKNVVSVTKPYGVNTLVSLNPIMVDGTGMCGCCRVRVAGVTKFSCVDGPTFDGAEVDWNELISRNNRFLEEERRALERYRVLIEG
ncbi:MAG: sulfide/dihydroorotate dehydrogenase-like FAD/NAD-binding protein [bacterium]|nr:sulfide/dihydroorotate dehydrogenase-like FAD/NAD-binding protein [bacterium]